MATSPCGRLGCGGAGAPAGSGPRLVPALELNAVAVAGQDDGGPLGERHFLGYGIDPADPGLTAALTRQRRYRRERIEATVARLGRSACRWTSSCGRPWGRT